MCLPFRIDDHRLRNDMHAFHRLATAIVFALLVTACSAPSPESVESTGVPVDTSAPSATLDAIDGAEQKSIRAYHGMWGAYVDAAASSDWRSPQLSRFATGTALTTLTQGLHTASDKGLVSRGQPVLHPSVISVEPKDAPTKAIVTDCGDSTAWTQQRVDNGIPADEEPSGRRRINAIVEKQVDESWKVVDFGVHEVGSC